MKVKTFIKGVVRMKSGLIMYGKKNTGLEATRIDGTEYTLVLPPHRLPRKWKKTIKKRVPIND